ncbi:MAG: hypothetical protein RL404_2344 [Pseudomonadota bacterium]|jgi:hypothetical protein
MEAQEAHETAEHEHGTPFKARSALQISILAMILAIANLGGDNSTKEAQVNDQAASNLFSFYQAKNVRQTQYKIAADELELSLVRDDKLSPAAREKIEKKIADYRKNIERYESEPETGEGKKELLAKAKEAQEERDHHLRKDPWFDYGASLLQIAIVLASIAIVITSNALLASSLVVGVFGTLSALNGFFLLI